MKHFTSLLALILLVTSVDDGAYAAWILPPEASTAATRAIGISAKADRAGILRSANLDKSTIKVEARRGDTLVLGVTLVHPSQAPEGAFRAAGVALLEAPGPLDPKALKQLKALLGAAKTAIPWREQPDEAPELSPEASAKAEEVLRHATYLKKAEAPDKAREVLQGLDDALAPHIAVRAAVLWTLLDAPLAAKAALSGLGKGTSAYDASARAILGAPLDVEQLLGELKDDAACEYTEVSRTLKALGRKSQARALAEGVLKRAPGCPSAWEATLHRRLEDKAMSEALALAEQALERFPTDKAPDGLLSTIASAHVAHERFAKAAELLELVARRTPTDESVVRVLLSAMLRDASLREAHTARLEAQRVEMPDDIITRFLLGIVYHYANRFDESTALLAPLETTLGHQGRLHIYLAMNDFNLGKIEPALTRLDAAAEGSDPDPDVFYCRAEILRDTRREQARADLARYEAMSRGSHMSNPEKNARVSQMLRDLDGCLETKVPVCESLWEHPRLKPRTDKRDAEPPVDDTPMWPRWLGAIALALLAGTLWWVLRARGQ